MNLSSDFPTDDTDHFQQVRRNRNNYNDILESFLMEQQDQHRKQFRKINDEEFSDEVSSDNCQQQCEKKLVHFVLKVG